MTVPAARRTVRLRVRRYDPEKGKGWWQEYEVPAFRGMTVLDALLYVKESVDHTIAVRYSCRMGVCGSCGMVINGRPRLACQTQLFELGSETVTVEPLPNHPVIRDLVTDFTEFFAKHASVKPFLIRRNAASRERPVREYLMKPDEYHAIYQFSYCIYCGICYSACPVVGVDREYLGPQALLYVYRYLLDVRDEAKDERLDTADSTHGCHRCHFALSCSAACPKGADPGYAIQLLRRMTLQRRLGRLRLPDKGAPEAPPLPTTKPKIQPPKPTVESPMWVE